LRSKLNTVLPYCNFILGFIKLILISYVKLTKVPNFELVSLM